MKYLPDYISIGQQVHYSFSEWHVLQNLAKKATGQLVDPALKQQYRSLYKRTVDEVKNNNCNDKSVIEDLQSMQLQKLIYRPYLPGIKPNKELFKKAFKVLDDEENWNIRIKEISKTNLGLTGLAGVGLLIMETLFLECRSN